MIIGLTVILFLAVFVVAGYLRLRAKAVDPRVTMESKERMPGKQPPAQQTAIPTLIDGEVARTADRIGEATALALSACLYASVEQTRGAYSTHRSGSARRGRGTKSHTALAHANPV